MATKIIIEPRDTTMEFKNLNVGDKFMVLAKAKEDQVYVKTHNVFDKSRDLYLKNAVNLSSGHHVEYQPTSPVIPVDVAITAYK